MSPQHLVAVFVRLFAIWLLTTTVQVVGMINGLVNLQVATGLSIYIWLVIPMMTIFFALMFWRFHMAIALLLLPKSVPNLPIVLRSKPADWIAAASIVIGLFSIIGIIPNLLHDMILMIYSPYQDYREFTTTIWTAQNLAIVIYDLTALLLGVLLVSKPWKIAQRLLRSSDYALTAKPSSADDSSEP